MLMRRRAARADLALSDAARALVADMIYELVPMKSVEPAIADLAPGADVSVTCSPVKGLGATQELTERLLALGHHPIPHLSARLVEGPTHVAALARWIRATGLSEVFVVGGDAEQPVGPYADAHSFTRDLLEHDTGLTAVGFTAYPDGHALIPTAALDEALHAKQALLAAAGLAGSVTTQMCFDPATIVGWLRAERAAGFELPVRVGLPGVVDRAKLMTMGARLGIGASLRYLSKNRASITKMLAPGGYDPTDLVTALAPDTAALGIVGIHSFTFNSVADTLAWQEALLA